MAADDALEQNRYTEEWRRIGASMPEPKAILCVSAHWMTHGTAVTAMDKRAPFTTSAASRKSCSLFNIRRRSPHLAARVRELLLPVEVQLDKSWGLTTHWSVLTHMFPDANLPVVS